MWVRLRPSVDDVRGWLLLSAGLLAGGGGGGLLLASATADPFEVPNFVAVTAGEVKCSCGACMESGQVPLGGHC